MQMIDRRLLERLHRQARGDRWRVSAEAFAEALEASAAKAFAGAAPEGRAFARYLGSLHLEDLALAVACAAGDEEAWGHFVLEQRPALYRAVDAIDPSGNSRDLADSLYADLFGLGERGKERQPLFRYFHGRSSLTTWLRAVIAQRYVDRMRSNKRTTVLPDEESPSALVATPQVVEPERNRYVALMRKTLTAALAALASKDRLRLGCYYAQQLTLAQTGRLLGEHEATVSRQLARSRRAVRDSVERQLKTDYGLTEAEVTECFSSVVADAGPLDLGDVLAPVQTNAQANAQQVDRGRKESDGERSIGEGHL